MTNSKPIPFIRAICKHKKEVEIEEAEQTFRRYLMLVKEICDLDEAESSNVEKNHD